MDEIETRRGTSALPFTDPHGLPLVLHETGDDRDFTPWKESPVPVEKQIRGLHSVRLWQRDLALTSSFLTGVLGFVDIGAENDWFGFEIGGGGSGRYLEIREIADADRGRWGTGGVHHVAWRVPNDQTELEMRERIDRARRRPTEVIRKAVKGMLPKNKLGRKMGKKLKVYAGPEHPHEAQKPERMEVDA